MQQQIEEKKETSIVIEENHYTQNDKPTKYKTPKKTNPLFVGLEFASVGRNLLISEIYILFICGIISVSMDRTDPIWNTTIPGAYCLALSILIYIWGYISEFNKEDKSVEEILNPRQWPEKVRLVLGILNRNESQCIFCFIGNWLVVCITVGKTEVNKEYRFHPYQLQSRIPQMSLNNCIDNAPRSTAPITIQNREYLYENYSSYSPQNIPLLNIYSPSPSGDNSSSNQSSPVFSSGVEMVKRSCAECRRVHKKCSKERPCSRCVKLGKTCFDLPEKKRGRPKKDKNNLNRLALTSSLSSSIASTSTSPPSSPSSTTFISIRSTPQSSNFSSFSSSPIITDSLSSSMSSTTLNSNNSTPTTSSILINEAANQKRLQRSCSGILELNHRFMTEDELDQLYPRRHSTPVTIPQYQELKEQIDNYLIYHSQSTHTANNINNSYQQAHPTLQNYSHNNNNYDIQLSIENSSPPNRLPSFSTLLQNIEGDEELRRDSRMPRRNAVFNNFTNNSLYKPQQ
ncbi:hypothetical protein ABK040_015356 [Willaertia magna]